MIGCVVNFGCHVKISEYFNRVLNYAGRRKGG